VTPGRHAPHQREHGKGDQREDAEGRAPSEARERRRAQRERAEQHADRSRERPARHVLLVPVRRRVHQHGLREPHERAGRGVQQHHREQQRQEAAAERDQREPDRERDAAAAHERAAVPAVAQESERGLDQAAEHRRQRKQHADLHVGERQVVAHEGPGRRPRAEDELVEQLDGEQSRGPGQPLTEELPGRVEGHLWSRGFEGLVRRRLSATRS
jgi:hypothetical protein